MHSERYSLDAATASKINAPPKVAAFGTTVTRVLEHLALDRQIAECHGETDIFIDPPFEFKAVDALFGATSGYLYLKTHESGGPMAGWIKDFIGKNSRYFRKARSRSK